MKTGADIENAVIARREQAQQGRAAQIQDENAVMATVPEGAVKDALWIVLSKARVQQNKGDYSSELELQLKVLRLEKMVAELKSAECARRERARAQRKLLDVNVDTGEVVLLEREPTLDNEGGEHWATVSKDKEGFWGAGVWIKTDAVCSYTDAEGCRHHRSEVEV
jgi:hypothetical protein